MSNCSYSPGQRCRQEISFLFMVEVLLQQVVKALERKVRRGAWESEICPVKLI